MELMELVNRVHGIKKFCFFKYINKLYIDILNFLNNIFNDT